MINLFILIAYLIYKFHVCSCLSSAIQWHVSKHINKNKNSTLKNKAMNPIIKGHGLSSNIVDKLPGKENLEESTGNVGKEEK